MTARVTRAALQIHQWVGLVVGIQILFWVLGGLVMTAIPIERVRSEHHLVPPAPAALAPGALVPLEDAVRAAGVAAVREARLRSSPRGPVWVLESAAGTHLVDARSGRSLRPLASGEVERIAAAAYRGAGRPTAVEYHAAAPAETGREGPLWSVDFDDAERTRFYVAPDSGDVVTRRSSLWRFYDFFWRLHIMNFDDGEDFNHPLLVGTAAAALGVVLSGTVLLVSWLRRRSRASARMRA